MNELNKLKTKDIKCDLSKTYNVSMHFHLTVKQLHVLCTYRIFFYSNGLTLFTQNTMKTDHGFGGCNMSQMDFQQDISVILHFSVNK